MLPGHWGGRRKLHLNGRVMETWRGTRLTPLGSGGDSLRGLFLPQRCGGNVSFVLFGIGIVVQIETRNLDALRYHMREVFRFVAWVNANAASPFGTPS